MGETASRFVNLNGLEFHYLEWGNGERPLLLCLHGNTGQAQVWNFLGRELSDSWQAIALDMRGHGRSAWANRDYAIASFASDVAALVDHLNATTVHLVGLSLGGLVAMSYAAAHPTRVNQLSLVDIAPEMSPVSVERLTTSKPYPAEFPSLDAAVAWARTDYLWAGEAVLRDDLALRLYRRENGVWTWYVDPDLFSPKNRKRWADEALTRWQSFSRIDCPILEIRGELSEMVSDKIVGRMKETNPRVECIDIPDAGHNVIADQPRLFLDAIVPRLSR